MADPNKILLIQLKRAGDVILTTPVAELAKRRWPAARVDFLVEKPFAPLLEHNPFIGRVQVYDKLRIVSTLRRLRAERYDLILDFQSSPRSAIACLVSGAARTAGYAVTFWGRAYDQTVRRPGVELTVVAGKLSLLEALGGPAGDVPESKIYLTEEERAWAKGTLCGLQGRRWIGLVPTHRRSSRRWRAESFAELARKIDQAGHCVLLFWGPGEKACVESLAADAPQARLIPPTTLRQMAALLERCQLVVTNDNGPMHLAAAAGAPTVTIYGPTDPHAWNPGGERHTALAAEGLSCLRCNLNVCPFGHECMKLISPEQVWAACQRHLAPAPNPALV
jgi:lipopolysaccharide heptosyltransferase II